MKGILRVWILAFGLLTLMGQGCSDVGFKTDSSSKAPNSPFGFPGEENTENFVVPTDTVHNKVDILFVLDESVSMNGIISNVRAGFLGMSQSVYTSDTLMAVTNMAPARYTAPNVFNLSSGFNTDLYVAQQPGFMKLVNSASIGSFKAAQPSMAAQFPLPGCAAKWFAPSARDASNNPCLVGATQVALQATGVEAGLVSVDQLASVVQSQGARLFRQGALAHVIFVSDTHDAGAPNYYGATGAPAAMRTYTDLRTRITALNPGLEALRFNGIVPLPAAGDARLAGVKVIGNLPAVSGPVTGEDVNDYSYLNFIRGSGGVAMHPVGNNWPLAMAEMMKELKTRTNPIVTLSGPVIQVIRIVANGDVLTPNEYQLLPGNRIEIIARASWPSPVSITVTYK